MDFCFSVFCRFGGWLETTFYIHFTRRWVEARRRSSASREKKDEEKAEKNAILRSWALWGRVVNRPVQLTDSALPGPALSGRGVCGLTAARHVSVPGVFHNLHCAYFGESTPGVRRKSPTSLWRHRYSAAASTSLSMKGVRPAVAGLYRWRWL